jgi:hypothetical protein
MRNHIRHHLVTEDMIRDVCLLLACGQSEDDAYGSLVIYGLTDGEARCVIIAARMLNRYTEEDTETRSSYGAEDDSR